MEKRKNYKDTQIKGRNFRISKFDAMTGSYIAYTLMSEALPMGIGSQIGVPQTKSQTKMKKEDFMELQRDCLKVCCEMLPAGPAPILTPEGAWGVIDIEDDTATVLALTIQTLAFNVSSFFDESLLDSIAKVMQNTQLPIVRT